MNGSRLLRFLALALALALAMALTPLTLGAVAASAAPEHERPKPQRIVSTNLCTDQMLLRLVEPERIVSLTFLSWEDDATPAQYLPLLQSIKPNRGLVEEVLMMDPDLVVSDSFSARFSNELLVRLGQNTVLFKPENTFEEWYAGVRRMGEAVGEPERAERLIQDFQTTLARLQAQLPEGPPPIFANLAGNNWRPGNDTLYAEIVNAGGFITAGQARGYSGFRNILLEELIQIDAELVSVSTRYSNPPSMTTEGLKHPLLRTMVRNAAAIIDIPYGDIICITPETLNMVEALVAARQRVEAARRAQQSG